MLTIESFSKVRVLCLGDLMLDRYVTGIVTRISPERPVPVFASTDARDVPGGAANVARNIIALGGTVTLVGVIGIDDTGRRLSDALARSSRISLDLIKVRNRPTTEKTRFVCQGQHVLRVDQEDSGPLAPEYVALVIAQVERLMPGHDALVLSDYNKGVLSDEVITAAITKARSLKLPVIVDPKSVDLARYAGATVVTPNAKETYDATRINAKDDDQLAELAGQKIISETGIESVLITRSENGMTFVRKDGTPLHIPAHAREVFDVVGAGDTVIATLALALGAGLELSEAAQLANVAAGIVVGKRDTATVSAGELADEVSRQPFNETHQLGGKVMNLDELTARLNLWRQDGLKIGFTNGCFDLLHVGHLRVINFSKSNCDRLIVALNSDSSIKRLKGPTRPVKSQPDRALIIAALAAVDGVIIFDDDTPLSLIRLIKPDVLIKGADYSINQIVGAEDVLAYGGRIATCELVPGKSTTKIIEQLAGEPQ